MNVKTALRISAVASVVAIGVFSGAFLRGSYEARLAKKGFQQLDGLEASVPNPVSVLDSGIEPGEYFRSAQQLLQNYFHKEITDSSVLTHGALDSMMTILGDSGTRFYTPKAWDAYNEAMRGNFVGIAADIVIEPAKIGSQTVYGLKVFGVAPHGAADKGGLKPDDEIAAVNGKWLIAPPLIRRWQADQAQYAAQKITIQELQKRFEVFRQRFNSAMSLSEAAETLNVSGPTPATIVVLRGEGLIEVTCERQLVESDCVFTVAETVVIRSFGEGAADQLQTAIGGKKELTIDLRGNAGGKLEEVANCLKLLIPAGAYARTQREPKGTLNDLSLKEGVESPPKITLLIDRGTAREAELFVAAVRDRAGAKIIGGPSRGFGVGLERIGLQDGSGYTITTVNFFDLAGQPLARKPDTKSAFFLPNSAVEFPRHTT